MKRPAKKPAKLTPKKPAKPRKKPAAGTAAPTRSSAGDWIPSFLAALCDSGNIRYSCTAAGISREAAYKRRHEDAEFAKDWQAALDEAIDKLEEAARNRALASSDTLLIFLLKSHRPEIYGDRVKFETPTPTVDITRLSDGDKERLLGILRAAQPDPSHT